MVGITLILDSSGNGKIFNFNKLLIQVKSGLFLIFLINDRLVWASPSQPLLELSWILLSRLALTEICDELSLAPR